MSMIRIITTADTQPTTMQDVDAQEVDSMLGSLGLTFISANTLPRFLDRWPGNRLTVRVNGTQYTFTSVPADER